MSLTRSLESTAVLAPCLMSIITTSRVISISWSFEGIQLTGKSCTLACFEAFSEQNGGAVTQRDVILRYPNYCRGAEPTLGYVLVEDYVALASLIGIQCEPVNPAFRLIPSVRNDSESGPLQVFWSGPHALITDTTTFNAPFVVGSTLQAA